MNNFLFAWVMAVLAGCLCSIQGMTVEGRLVVFALVFGSVFLLAILFSIVQMIEKYNRESK